MESNALTGPTHVRAMWAHHFYMDKQNFQLVLHWFYGRSGISASHSSGQKQLKRSSLWTNLISEDLLYGQFR